MLTALAIQDIVLIDRLSLKVGGGLTALTGETGAGKSILLDSLGLATGAKAEKGLVRHGQERGVVTATFEVPPDHGVWAVMEEGGLPQDSVLAMGVGATVVGVCPSRDVVAVLRWIVPRAAETALAAILEVA